MSLQNLNIYWTRSSSLVAWSPRRPDISRHHRPTCRREQLLHGRIAVQHQRHDRGTAAEGGRRVSHTIATQRCSAVWLRYRVAMRFVLEGSLLKARAWNRSLPEPTTWSVQATDTSLAGAGNTGIRAMLEAGNVNVLPVSYGFDTLTVQVTNRTYQELLEGD